MDAPTSDTRSTQADWDAPAAGAGAASASTSTSDNAESAPAPYGDGSARPGADGSGPEGWAVKGNEDSMLYHSEKSPHFGRTRAEVWFRDEETAQRAGFTRWDRSS